MIITYCHVCLADWIRYGRPDYLINVEIEKSHICLQYEIYFWTFAPFNNYTKLHILFY